MKIVLFCLQVVFFLGCTHSQKSSQADLNESVDVQLPKHKTVRLEKSPQPSKDIGPHPLKPRPSLTTEGKKVIVRGVYLYPAGSMSFGYLYLIEQLKNRGIKFHALSGTGLSALLAAMYCKYQDDNTIYWKLYTLQKELKQAGKWYGRKWRKVIDKYIDSEFSNDLVERLPLLFSVALIEDGERRVRHTGNLAELLKKSFQLSGATYSVLAKHDKMGSSIFDPIGLDLKYELSLYPGQFTYQLIDELYLGLFGKLKGHFLDDSFHHLNLKLEQVPIDKIIDYGVLRQTIDPQLPSLINLIKEKEEQWQNTARVSH